MYRDVWMFGCLVVNLVDLLWRNLRETFGSFRPSHAQDLQDLQAKLVKLRSYQ